MSETSSSYRVLEAKATTVTQRRMVKLVFRCFKCGEVNEVIFSKKDIKGMLKRMKLPPREANLEAEKELREKGVY